MSPNVEKLPNDAGKLKEIISDLYARNQQLEEQLRLFKKELFGQKNEKRIADYDENQLQLFNEAESLVEKEDEEPQTIPSHTRRKPKRKPLPEHLPRVDVIHDIDEKDKVCQCGHPLDRIGEEVSEKLDIIPAKVRVIRHIRPKYACKSCEGVESDGPTVAIAPPPAAIIPKGMATEGLLAHVITSKYVDALPLYRQEKMFARHGIDIPRSTMATWMVAVAKTCLPIMDLLKQKLLSGPLINADETPIQVLKEPDRANTKKSYMWLFRGGPPDKPVVMYLYAPTRSGDVAEDVLSGYSGYCQTDAYAGYNSLEKETSDIKLVGCFAHVRRKFVKVIDARPKAMKNKTGSAEVALNYIRQLYGIEKKAREQKLPPEDIKGLRDRESAPVLKKFRKWMDKRQIHTPPRGLLGKAFNYAISNWNRLERYVEDGHISIDNNAAENAIRPFVIGRKNFLFAGHPNGADAAATYYSLIETAKACGLEPYWYLRYLFEKFPLTQSDADLENLLPQNISSNQLAAFIAQV